MLIVRGTSRRPVAHHFIPQFHLRLFGDRSKNKEVPHVHFLDIRNGTLAIGRPHAIAVRNGYNDVRGVDILVNGEPVNLETAYSRVESRLAPAVQQLAEAGAAADLSDANMEPLLLYMAIQATRTPAFRALQLKLSRELAALAKEKIIREWMTRPLSPRMRAVLDSVKVPNVDGMATALQLQRAHDLVAPYFLRQHWVLLRATLTNEFLLGDACVSVLEGTQPPHVVDFTGANPGVEFVMPVSPALALMTRPELSAMRVRDLSPEEILVVNRRTMRASERWLYGSSRTPLEAVLRHREDPVPEPIRV